MEINKLIMNNFRRSDPGARTYPKKSKEIPVFRGLRFRNIRCRNAKVYGLSFEGIEESPIRDLSLEQIHICAEKGVSMDHCEGLRMRDCQVQAKTT